jgi:hypothetical protein
MSRRAVCRMGGTNRGWRLSRCLPPKQKNRLPQAWSVSHVRSMRVGRYERGVSTAFLSTGRERCSEAGALRSAAALRSEGPLATCGRGLDRITSGPICSVRRGGGGKRDGFLGTATSWCPFRYDLAGCRRNQSQPFRLVFLDTRSGRDGQG